MMSNYKKNPILTPSTGCPAGYGFIPEGEKTEPDSTQEGVNVLADAGGISYGEYLQLDKILSAQEPQSRVHGENTQAGIVRDCFYQVKKFMTSICLS